MRVSCGSSIKVSLGLAISTDKAIGRSSLRDAINACKVLGSIRRERHVYVDSVCVCVLIHLRVAVS